MRKSTEDSRYSSDFFFFSVLMLLFHLTVQVLGPTFKSILYADSPIYFWKDYCCLESALTFILVRRKRSPDHAITGTQIQAWSSSPF